MTQQERIMAAMEFRQPDAIPYYDNTWGEFNQQWQEKIIQDNAIVPHDYYQNDMLAPICPDEFFFFHDEGKLRDEPDAEIWDSGWGTTDRLYKNSHFSEPVDRRLKEKSDLDKLIFDPVGLDERYTGAIALRDQELQTNRAIFAKVGGFYCRTQFLRGEPELLMDMVLDPPFCHELFDRTSEHLTNMALESLKRLNTYDTGLWVYDDMAGSNAPMFGPDQFEEYLLPRYKKMIDKVRAAGCKHVIFHCDGNMVPLIDMLLDAGFDGFNPLEPRCCGELPELINKTKRKFIAFGGVCAAEILPRGDKKELEAHLRPLLEVGKAGGVILGAASIAGDVDPEIYDWYRKFLKEHGGN